MVYVHAATKHIDDSQVQIRSDVEGPTGNNTLWFRLDKSLDPPSESIADAIFPIGLLNAMMTDGELEMEAPVSPRLLHQADTIQDILLAWYGSKLSRAQVNATARLNDTDAPADGVAACFSGGVDSLYTLVKHEKSINSLVYVHGFDVPLTKQKTYDETAQHLKQIAVDKRKRMILVATNLKLFFKAVPRSWGPITHGAAIASIGMLLSREHGTLLVPSSHTYAELYPWGSHPLLDPMWSTEAISIVHDGAAVNRVRKTIHLANNRDAQHHLRVCWQNTGAYNCGNCEKCYRTKITLHLAGTLDRFETFDKSDVDASAIRRLKVTNASNLSFARENLKYANQMNQPEIAEALKHAIRNYENRDPKLKQLLSQSAAQKKANQELNLDNEHLRKKLAKLSDVASKMKQRKSLRFADAVGKRVKNSRKWFNSLTRKQ